MENCYQGMIFECGFLFVRCIVPMLVLLVIGSLYEYYLRKKK